MKRILSGLTFLTRISLRHGGPAPPKHGGHLQQRMTFGSGDLYGPVLIIVESLLLTNGRTSVRTSASWTPAVFPKIFITTTSHGGLIMMYCIFHLTGTGQAKKASQ